MMTIKKKMIKKIIKNMIKKIHFMILDSCLKKVEKDLEKVIDLTSLDIDEKEITN